MPPKDPNYWKNRRAAEREARGVVEWDPLDHDPSPASVKRHFAVGKTAAVKACTVVGEDGATCYSEMQRVNQEKYLRRKKRLAKKAKK